MKRGHLAWGLFLGALLVLAAGAWRSEGGRWLLLVDRSASLSGAALQVQDQVQILRAELGEGVQLQDFGDAAHTDLEAALRGALALHARTPLAGLVVLSDAQATRGDSEAGLRAVHTAGLPLHWRAVAAQGPALQLDELLAPQRATPGERVTLLQRWPGELSVPSELELLAQGPGGETSRVPLRPRFEVNAASAALVGAIAGRGITQVLSYMVAEELRAGALELVLEPFLPSPVPVHIVTPDTRLLAALARGFLDFAAPRLASQLAPEVQPGVGAVGVERDGWPVTQTGAPPSG